MPQEIINPLYPAIGIIVVLLLSILFLALFYKKAEPGIALIRYGVGGTIVSFNGMLSLPLLHKLYKIDISEKAIEIIYDEKHPLLSRDKKKIKGQFSFRVRVNTISDDVKRVALYLGAEKTFDQAFLEKKFAPLFKSCALYVAEQIDYADFQDKKEEFRYEIVNVIGTDLNGYILDDLVVLLHHE